MQRNKWNAQVIVKAVAEASRRALLRHKMLGESVATRKDGQLAVIQAEEIVVPEVDPDWEGRT